MDPAVDEDGNVWIYIPDPELDELPDARFRVMHASVAPYTLSRYELGRARVNSYGLIPPRYIGIYYDYDNVRRATNTDLTEAETDHLDAISKLRKMYTNPFTLTNGALLELFKPYWSTSIYDDFHRRVFNGIIDDSILLYDYVISDVLSEYLFIQTQRLRAGRFQLPPGINLEYYAEYRSALGEYVVGHLGSDIAVPPQLFVMANPGNIAAYIEYSKLQKKFEPGTAEWNWGFVLHLLPREIVHA
jgi:hypothetical protein